jgi:manganese/zinc/iron transport system permease protein
MTIAQIEIQLIAVVVSLACAIPGVFLVLRKMAMMSDAISHSILLGIVLAFFITKNLTSPLLIFGAALTGVLTVSLVELLNRSRLVREDSAIGLVFPLLFSIGVLLIARHAGDVHLDIDAVLLGELAFAPFDRLFIASHDIGPKSLYVMGGILLLNVFFILLFYKELKLATFDSGLSAALGFSPVLIHYSLMSLVSLTAVGAFDAVGSILVVALMIGPPVTAYLLTERLSRMMMLSGFIGIGGALSGYWLAHLLDASIAGSMATMIGFIFLLTFILAPDRGLLAIARRRARQEVDFAIEMLLVHLLNHEGLPEAERECRTDHLTEHLHWENQFIRKVLRTGEKRSLLEQDNGFLILTNEGRELARESMMR